MRRIAIIGGGAAGAALVGEFLRRPAHDVALTWLVGRRAPGRGVAYATSAEQHLLNVRAANMGLFADDVGALLRFAHERGYAVKGTDFLPRGVFGDYVESTLARLVATHATPRTLTLRTAEARSVRGNDAEGYVVATDDESHIEADAVVLAIGALPPRPLAGVACETLAGGRYAVDPWQLPRLAQAPRRVVVIGTGLTGVDVILSAAATWPDAKIVAVSRHGRLPQTHLPTPGAPYDFQGDLIDTLRARADVRAWLRALREAIDDADDWRCVVDGLRSATVELWQSLAPPQRARFLRHLRWRWEIVRHRMPSQSAEAIARLREQGRLEVLAGRVRRVDGSDAPTLHLDERNRGPRELDADLVIQATGFHTAVTDTDHPLVQQLVRDGLVVPDALGLGLVAHSGGRLQRRDGSAAQGLRAIGTLLRGALWECTGLPEIRTLAKTLAHELPLALAPADNVAVFSPRAIRARVASHIDMAIRQLGA